MAIKITADRIIDLKKEELDERGIGTISCYVNMNGKSYSDLEDIFPEDVYQHYISTKQLAKTAAKSPELYAEFFRQFTQNGDTVIHFAASSGISAICGHAEIAAKEVKNVYVVDTLSLSNGVALLVNYASSLIKEGKSAEQVHALCLEKRSKLQSSFLLDVLDFLYKGGRCNGFQFFTANLLKIKPVIHMNENGRMVVREKLRGKRKTAIAQYIKNTFDKHPDPDLNQLYISHWDNDKETLDYFLSEVAKYHKFKNIQINDCGCNCAIHSGKNCISLFFFDN